MQTVRFDTVCAMLQVGFVVPMISNAGILYSSRMCKPHFVKARPILVILMNVHRCERSWGAHSRMTYPPDTGDEML